MNFRDLMCPGRRTFAPADGDLGTGAQAQGEGAGAPLQPATGGDGAGAAAAARWWEAGYSPEEQQWIAAKGYAVEDQSKLLAEILPKAIKGHRAAEQMLGRPRDSILDKPRDGQPVTEWMREQREIFGLPENPDGYAIERPKDLADTIAWDAAFEAKAKAKAHELGLLPSQMQGMTELYAAQVQGMLAAADAEVAQAQERLMADLRTEWGDQAQLRLTRARQAASKVAEIAGFDGAALEGISQMLSLKAGGDANTIKLFAALGEMMGEDKMIGSGGAGSLGVTPSDARQRLAQMQQPGGAWYEASMKGNQAELARLRPEIERLTKIVAGTR